MQAGEVQFGGTFVVDHDELVAFAGRWDPQPFHLDDDAAAELFGSGGVTAPGVLIMAIRTRLLMDLPPLAIIAGVGWDEVRFHAPVRAGDTLQLRLETLETRSSASKPDRGIAQSRVSLINQDGDEVMSHLDTILVRRRPDV